MEDKDDNMEIPLAEKENKTGNVQNTSDPYYSKKKLIFNSIKI